MRNLTRFVIGLLFSCPLWGLSPLIVEGNRFVSAEGRTVVLRGFNTADPDRLEGEGHWNEAYIGEIAAWGANVVRFPVHPRNWRNRTPERYLELLDRGVEWAGEHGLYVIIDWHSIGNLLAERFQDPGYETTFAETRQFWSSIAGHFADNPVVAFYELFNEPTISGDQFGTMTWLEWKKAQETLIRDIRLQDADTIVLVAGFDWAYDLKPVRTEPVEGSNIAYVSHPYPMKRKPPWPAKWDEDWGFVADRYPVILTEVGFCLENERGAHIPVISTVEYGEALTAYTERKGISWVAWVFDARWAPMMFWDWDYSPTTQGKFFKDYLLGQGKVR